MLLLRHTTHSILSQSFPTVQDEDGSLVTNVFAKPYTSISMRGILELRCDRFCCDPHHQGVAVFCKAPAREECNGVARIDLGGRRASPKTSKEVRLSRGAPLISGARVWNGSRYQWKAR
jgi:hypothetical protein